MIPQECPTCHGRVSFANRTPYCLKCGWNRDSALSSARMSLNSLPIAVIMFVAFDAFLIFSWHFRNPAQIAIFTGVPSLGILINYITTKRTLRKLRVMPSTAATGGPAMATGAWGGLNARAAAAPSPTPSASDEALLGSPRPRQVRMARRGRINIAVGLGVVAVFATVFGVHVYSVWSRTQSFETFEGKDWLMAGLLALIFLIPYGMWRSQKRECELLENGEIAIASVTRQWNSDQKSSTISYEFRDIRGQTHQGMSFDYTNRLYSGMTVPVFYDRDNPKKNIAYCATQHEVIR